MFQVGDKLDCVYATPLKGKEVGPAVKLGEVYECKGIHLDSKGNQHIDIGLPLEINYVTSYETGEELPPTTHWCHPSRFIKV